MPRVMLSTGIGLFYEEHGQGEPLVLIMGTSADASYWTPQIEAYKSRYRVIAFDNRGAGRSDKPSGIEAYSMKILAADTAALLDALHIRTAHVSGLSLGSTVAQELALARPDLVGTLELHGTWGHSDAAFCYAIETMRYPLLLGDREGFVKTAFAWILSSAFLNDDAQREKLLAAVLGSPHPASVEGILGQIHADLTHESLGRLGAVRCPTLVTAGEVDIQVPPRLGHDVYCAIPDAEWHLYSGRRASHLACLEMADDFNRVTLEFLAKHPLST